MIVTMTKAKVGDVCECLVKRVDGGWLNVSTEVDDVIEEG